MSKTWYVIKGEGHAGPFSLPRLQQLADAEKLRPRSQVSRDLDNWTRASDIDGLHFLPQKRKRKKKPKPQEAAPTHVPYYEGGGSARKRLEAIRAGNLTLPGEMDTGARFHHVVFLAAAVAGALHVGVRIAYALGWLALDTTAASLGWRIGLPAAAFLLIFLIGWFSANNRTGGVIIHEDMTDEEIAQSLDSF